MEYKRVCPSCLGDKTVSTNITCSICNGSGRIIEEHGEYGPFPVKVACRACKGTGKEQERCFRCQGTGVIEE